jgi:hypothetical protein
MTTRATPDDPVPATPADGIARVLVVVDGS